MQTWNNKLNMLVKSRLQALLNWAYDKECTLTDGMTVDVTEFTNQIYTEWMCRSKKRSRAKDETSKKEDLKMPDTFDGKERTWKKKKRELLENNQNKMVFLCPTLFISLTIKISPSLMIPQNYSNVSLLWSDTVNIGKQTT